MRIQLSEELVELIESGVSILVGSRDADLRPECARALGATVAPDRRALTIYLSAGLGRRMCADFDDNRQVAITFSRILDHHTVQVKGVVRQVRPATDADVATQERYRIAFSEQAAIVGMPRSVMRRLVLVPSVAVEVEVRELFHQTPGPGAGSRIEPTA
ncbi:MAG: hypothetical protein IT379_29890 [Deltaproteobacteria bacterium]|nr:hypothetical protein [Deltaproteobacteria bacterium]